MSVTDALNQLAEAHGSKALASAFRSLQGQVRKARRGAQAAYGPLARTFAAAMEIWDAQKADGVSKADRIDGLAKSLKAAWPPGREWKYLCNRCDDTGWQVTTCTPETPCGRPFKLQGSSADDYTGRGRCAEEHVYCAPCWCEKGQMFRRHLEHTKAPARPEDYLQAARSKPSRVGR